MPLKLYMNILSPPVRAILLLAKEINLDMEFIEVNLIEREHLSQDYLKINPQHTIPTLVDGDFAIWDSHAIAVYLIGKYAKNDALYPKNLRKRAVIDQRLHFDSGVLFPAIKNVLAPIFFYDEKVITSEKIKAIQDAYDFLEAFLNNNKYLAGSTMTIADLCCVASVSTATIITPISGQKNPKLIKWYNEMKSLSYYKEANEEALNNLDALFHELLDKGVCCP